MQPRRHAARWSVWAAAAVLTGGFSAAHGGPESPTDKLDDLLGRWRGQTLEHLHAVWGREEAIELRAGNSVYVFERRIKVRASPFAISVYPNGGLRCVARFEVDGNHQIVRTTRLGGGRDCWNAFRKLAPD